MPVIEKRRNTKEFSPRDRMARKNADPPSGQNRIWDNEKVNVTSERTVGLPTKPADPNQDYKNIRDLK